MGNAASLKQLDRHWTSSRYKVLNKCTNLNILLWKIWGLMGRKQDWHADQAVIFLGKAAWLFQQMRLSPVCF